VNYLEKNREKVEAVDAHRALTDWIAKNPAQGQKMVQDELVAETRAQKLQFGLRWCARTSGRRYFCPRPFRSGNIW